MFNKKNIKFFLQLLGPIIFVYILSKIDYRLLAKEISQLKWAFLFLSFLAVVVEVFFRAMRWHSILSALEIKITKLSALSLHWLGLFTGIVTPGRLGELVKLYFLKNKGNDGFRSFFSIIIDRISDLLVLLIFGFLAAIFFTSNIAVYVFLFGIFLAVAIVLVFLIIDKRSRLHLFFSWLINRFFSVNFSKYSNFTYAKLWQRLKDLKIKNIFQFLLFLFLSWVFYFLSRYCISIALNLNLSFFNIILITSLMSLISSLPISIAGLGTREAVAIYFFNLSGLSSELAVLFSLLVFFVDCLVISIGLVPYLKELAIINKIKKI